MSPVVMMPVALLSATATNAVPNPTPTSTALRWLPPGVVMIGEGGDGERGDHQRGG